MSFAASSFAPFPESMDFLLDFPRREHVKMNSLEELSFSVKVLTLSMNSLVSGVTEVYQEMAGKQTLAKFMPLGTPIPNARVTSKFGRRIHPIFNKRKDHQGVDLAAPMGTPFVATGMGVVVSTTPASGYGNRIIVSHGHGVYSLYAHNKKNLVKRGQIVRRGQVIGLVGSTGHVTGPHLHYEIIINNSKINPLKVMHR